MLWACLHKCQKMVEMGDIGLDGEDENKQMEEQKPK
jgi:hypothetical protein